MIQKCSFINLLFLINLFLACACKQSTIKDDRLEGKAVEVREQNGKFQLYRNGFPYFIEGAGGYEHFEEIKEIGGNSIRIWSTENAKEILDKAHELGLSVTVGLKVAYADTEMNYGNSQEVAEQHERLKKEVLKYKDHPALLMWGIGNEPTLYLHPYSIIEHNRTWAAIDDIAKMIHEVDPDHPTTTMLQDLPEKTIFYISKFCNNIDIISINIFRNTGDEKISDVLQEYGWNGPFMISEYGALGYWAEDNYTDWYALNEKTSTQKAQFIQEFYQDQIKLDKGRCLGSYVFYWGQKHEYTSTWLSLFTESGAKTEMIDRLEYLWTNKWPRNRAPSIHSLVINNFVSTEEIYIKAGTQFTATINAYDPELNNLALEWEIVKDDTERHFDATQNQKKPEVIDSGRVLSKSRTDLGTSSTVYNMFEIRPLPHVSEGPYRLFIYIKDEYGKVATANAAYYVIK